MTRAVLVLSLLLPACADDTEGLSNGDAGPPVACPWPTAPNRAPLEPGRTSTDLCNECNCIPRSEDAGVALACTAAFCVDSAPRCDQTADCIPPGSFGKFCHFDPGCEGQPGRCTAVQSICQSERNPPATADDDDVFCGCDGVTYRGAACIGRPWRHRGRCR